VRRRPSTCSGWAAGEGGFATPFAIGLIGLLVGATVFAAAVGGVLVTQRRVSAAADLAVLAGASALQRGGSACAAAGRVARSNGARLTACGVQGSTLLVRVTATAAGLFGTSVTVRAQARAGPA
jgi:secretion/DNA translocation related TadE-like protein